MYRRGVADQFRINCEGSMGVVMALFMTVSVAACALAIDMGALYLERRSLQGASDIAAVVAAGDLARAEEAVRATLAANGVPEPRALSVVKGRYTPDPSVAREQRFVAGLEPFNAVRVNVTTGGRLYFAKSIIDEPDISVTAIGTTASQATFSIGSRLAAVQGGIANAILGALLGGKVGLSVMDYNALATANVKLLDFLSALSAEVGVTAGSYSDVLKTNATVGNLLRATAAALASSSQGPAAQAVLSLLSAVNANALVKPQTLVDLGPLTQAQVGQPHAGLGADLNVMSLITAISTLANGQNQVAVNLGGAVPGLLSLTLNVAIGEPMQHSGWVTVGQPGASVRTAQTRLRLVAEVGGSGLLSGIRVRLPVYIELASAEARLVDITCPGTQGGQPAAVIEGRPALVRAWIGDVAPGGLSHFATSVPVVKGNVVDSPLLRVTASAFTEMSQAGGDGLTFTESDVSGHVVKTVAVRDHLSSLTSSLLRSATVNIQIIGLGIGLGQSGILSLLTTILTPVTALLDSLLAPLLQLVGVRLGEADIQTNGLRCGAAVLSG